MTPAARQGTGFAFRWPFLVATGTVDAAAGLLAGAAVNLAGAGHAPAAVFASCALALVACHLVLLPGWVWAPGPPRLPQLLRRTGLAALTLALVVMAAFCGGMALAALPDPFGSAPGGTVAALWTGRVLLAAVFAGAGALLGLGAAAAQASDGRPAAEQPPRATFEAHVWGGAAAVLPPLLLAWAADADALGPDLLVRTVWPALPFLAAAALVPAGLPHAVLLLRGDRAFRPPAGLPRRIAFCAVAAAVPVLGMVATTPPPRTPPLHVSPGSRYAILLVSDDAFGQTEWLRVIAAPGTPAARLIFERAGDVPFRFLRWTGTATAELAVFAPGIHPPVTVSLTCQAEECALR